jgi:hypothetical protein
MKTIIYLFTTGILLAFSTCKKQPAQVSFEQELIGKWKYTGKSGGFAGKYEAADLAVMIMIEFKKDRKYIKTTNDKVTDSGHYDLIRMKSIYTGQEDNAIRFNVSPLSASTGHIITIKDNKLELSDNFYDGYSSGYTRFTTP